MKKLFPYPPLPNDTLIFINYHLTDPHIPLSTRPSNHKFFNFQLVTLSLGQAITASPQTSKTRQLSVQSKETSTADFVRLLVMRLIFGVASAMGYGESLSNFLGGALVPPGAEYDDDDYDLVPDLF